MHRNKLMRAACSGSRSPRSPARRAATSSSSRSLLLGRPYAAGGSGFGGGIIDYMRCINERDGGINGVKLTWEKCETEYNNARGVECYERLKKNATAAPPSSIRCRPASPTRSSRRSPTDKIPMITMGYGRTDAADGRVFPYVFPLITTYWSQATVMVKYIGAEERRHGQAEGQEDRAPLPRLGVRQGADPGARAHAKKYGYELTTIAVPHPGNEQQSQWLQIRQIKPDYVILWGWGVMNPTALKAAAKVGYPRDKMIGVWWSGAEEDVIPAGDAAKGYIAAGFNAPGTELPGDEGHPEVRLRQGQGRVRGQVALRLDLSHARRGRRHRHRRGDPHRAGEVRQGQADDRRADALGHREPEHRPKRA